MISSKMSVNTKISGPNLKQTSSTCFSFILSSTGRWIDLQCHWWFGSRSLLWEFPQYRGKTSFLPIQCILIRFLWTLKYPNALLKLNLVDLLFKVIFSVSLQCLSLSVEASFWPYCALCNFAIVKCRNLHVPFQSSDERWVSSYDDWAVFCWRDLCSQGLNGLYLDGAFFSLWALLTHKQVWGFFVYAWHKHTLMNASCLYFGMHTGWTRNLPINSQPALFSHHPVFPGGLPSKSYPGTTLLSFWDQMRRIYGCKRWQGELLCAVTS